MPNIDHVGLTPGQVQSFIDDGFVRIENAFSADLAKQCRDALWAEIGLSPDEPEQWARPVVRVGFKSSPPFVAAANTPQLHAAYNSSSGRAAGWPPRASEPFRSAFPRRNRPVTMAGMWM